MARVFISRDLPFPALDRLSAEHEVDVWEERTPPPADVFLARARDADALLTCVTEQVDGEFLDRAAPIKAVATTTNAAIFSRNITATARPPVGWSTLTRAQAADVALRLSIS